MVALPLSESSESFVVAGARGLGLGRYSPSSSSWSRSRRRGGRSPSGRSPRGWSGCMTKSQQRDNFLGGGTTKRLPASLCTRTARSPVRNMNPPSAEKRLVSGARVLGFSRLCRSVVVIGFDYHSLLSGQSTSRSDAVQTYRHRSVQILDVDAVCSTAFNAFKRRPRRIVSTNLSAPSARADAGRSHRSRRKKLDVYVLSGY